MKFITVDTSASQKTERLLRSCRRYGIDLQVLGLGRPYLNHGAKIQFVLEYLEGADADETIMYVDGYDVVFLAGADEIQAKFRSFDHPFVVSTEQNCNVDGGLAVRLPIWLRYPKGKPPYRFINSGSYVGRAGYMRDLLTKLQVKPSERDQSFFNRYFVSHPGAMALDYEHQIFTCTAGRTGLEEDDYRLEGERLRNTITGSLPSVLHCPGKNYIGLEKLIAPLPIAAGAYRPSEAERKTYRRRRFINRLNASVYPDNFLFHLALDSALALCGILVLVFLISYLA